MSYIIYLLLFVVIGTVYLFKKSKTQIENEENVPSYINANCSNKMNVIECLDDIRCRCLDYGRKAILKLADPCTTQFTGV